MMSFYDDWLRFDKWNTEQAAFIFNGRDPNVEDGKVQFPERIEENEKLNKKDWQRKICHYYHVFEFFDWEKYIDAQSDPYFYFNIPKEASPYHFFSIAEDKQLDLPPELLEKWEWSEKKDTSPSTENKVENAQPENDTASPLKTNHERNRR